MIVYHNSMNKQAPNRDLFFTKTVDLTGQLMSKFIEKGNISPRHTKAIMSELLQSISEAFYENFSPIPAVPIAESIKDDYIVCLEDGARVKSLKNYIKKNFSMTPEEYRQKWHLPHDYPMVNEKFSQVRSNIAKKKKNYKNDFINEN